MAKLRMQCGNLNGHIFSMKIINSPACSCRFINNNEFHLLLICPLYNRPTHTSKFYAAHSTLYSKNPIVWRFNCK